MNSPAARYTVIIERFLGEQDGDAMYHDGTGKNAVAQLAKELQEAWDAAGVEGEFQITERRIVDTDSAVNISDLPGVYEDNPDPDLPARAVRPGSEVDFSDMDLGAPTTEGAS